MDVATVEKIARLARLNLSPEKKESFAQDLSQILDWMKELEALDTSGVNTLSKIHDIPTPMRRDEVNDGEKQNDVLANAPEVIGGYFVVPKVVE